MRPAIYNKHRSSKSRWTTPLILLWVAGWLCACASVPLESNKESRTCDAWADAAVASQQWQQAVGRHEKVLASDLSNCLAMYHLGYLWGRLEDKSKEITWYKKAIACGEGHNDTLYFNLGMAYADLRQMENARAAFKRAVRINSKKADNHFGLGLVARVTGDNLGAERALKQALTVSPHHWDSRILLAKIYLDQDRLEPARRHLEFMLARVPENEEAINLYKTYKKRRMTAYER